VRAIYRRAIPAALVVLLLLGTVLPAHAQSGPGGDPRWTPRERQDPLEPLSLEPVAGRGPGPPPAPADTTGGRATAGERPPTGGGKPAAAAADSSESVAVVRLRAVIVGRTDQAQRLVELLRGGATLDAARRALGGLAGDEVTRELALEDLRPGLREEVQGLAEGGWTGVHPWRDRAALFQVVAKDNRRRSTLPKLGEGLDEKEQARLANLHHPMPTRAPRVENPDQGREYQAAAVVQQERPAYPPSAMASGDVTVEVKIGLADDVVDAQVTSSTDPIFEPPALTAARRSTYRSARRNGVPEPASLRLTFRFVAPSTAPPDSQPH
jgi:hypothetical protein